MYESLALSSSLKLAPVLVPALTAPPPPPKVSGFWSSVGYKIGVVTCFFILFFYFFGNLFCFANRQIRDTLYTQRPNFPYTKYGGYERPHIMANVHTPMWKSHLNHITAEFQLIRQCGCNWTLFHRGKIFN